MNPILAPAPSRKSHTEPSAPESRITRLIRQPAVFWGLLAAMVAAGCAGILASTPYGLGLVNDSAAYVGGARNLVDGYGYVRTSGGGEHIPLTHFPPLFSLLLAGVSEAAGALGLEVIPTARVVVALLFGLSVALVGLLVYRLTRSSVFGLFGAFLFLVSDTFLDVYVYLLSEPLFLALLLVSFLLLFEVFRRTPGRRWIALLGVGATIGLASLTRYVGFSLLIPATLALWVYSRDGESHRRLPLSLPLRETVLVWASALLPIILWTMLTRTAGGAGSLEPGETAFGNRTLAWHPIDPAALWEAVKNLLSFLAPDRFLYVLPILGKGLTLGSLLVLPGVGVYLVWALIRRRGADQAGQAGGEEASDGASPATTFALAVFIPVYLAALVISISFLDASTPLNTRILSMAYLAELILLAAGLAWLWERASRGAAPGPAPARAWVRPAIILACAGLAAFGVWDGVFAVQRYSQEGLGFAHRGWRESPALGVIDRTPGAWIYSNRPTAIYLLTGRPAYAVPSPVDAVTAQERDTYRADLEVMQGRIQSGKAILVLFELHASADAGDQAWYQDLIGDLPLLGDYGHAVVYGRMP